MQPCYLCIIGLQHLTKGCLDLLVLSLQQLQLQHDPSCCAGCSYEALASG